MLYNYLSKQLNGYSAEIAEREKFGYACGYKWHMNPKKIHEQMG
jgi:hypothetical protein